MFTYLFCFSSELRSCVKIRGGRPGLPVPNKPYAFSGRKAPLMNNCFGCTILAPIYSGSAPKGLLAFRRSHALIEVSSRTVTFLANQLFVSWSTVPTGSVARPQVRDCSRLWHKPHESPSERMQACETWPTNLFLPPLAQRSVLATCTSYNWFWAC